MGEELIPFRIPLRMPFRGVTERTGVLVGIDGRWGEFSPFPDYSDEAAAPWAGAALEAARGSWPEPLRDEIPINAIVPAVDPDTAHRLTAASGCTTIKVKVAEGDDEARVAAVRDALGPDGSIRVDANGAWTVEEAVAAIARLARYDLEYVEQPVATVEEMKQVRRAIEVPIAADESVRKASDPLAIARAEAADVVILKVHPLGGVRRCLAIAEACGLPVVVSSAVESSVGLGASLALAAALPGEPRACGIGTAALLGGDVTHSPLLPTGGFLHMRSVAPDPDLLDRWSLTGPEGDELVARFRRVAALTDAPL